MTVRARWPLAGARGRDGGDRSAARGRVRPASPGREM